MIARVRSALWGDWVGRVIAFALIAAVLQLVIAPVFGAGEAAGHARLHAIFALAVGLVGAAILATWPAAGWASRLPALGLGVLAWAWIVESLGAYGFGADNDARVNVMVVLHDLALQLVGIGMLAAAIGVGGGLAIGARRRTGPARWMAAAGVVVAIAGGLFVFVTMGGISL